MMYAQINVLNRIISLHNEQTGGLVPVDNLDVIQSPQNYQFADGDFSLDVAPSEYHSLDANGNWYLNNDVLQQTKEAMWLDIKQRRDSRLNAGFACAGKWWHSDNESRIKYLGLLMLGANMPTTIYWKTMDGSFVQMTPTLAGQLFNAAATFDTTTFTIAEQHKAAMQASSDPIHYDFSANWPLIFGE